MTFQRAINESQQPAPAVRDATSLATPEPVAGRIGRITYVAADAAWPAGAAPLARWLRANPDVLGDLLGMKLVGTDDEVPGGLAAAVFSDQAGRHTLAVLELGASSEAMLGSLLIRLSSVQAGTAVWICGQPRDEHLSAVSWLNHSVASRFFVARIRAARIEASEPAPILELVLRPPRASAGDPDQNGADAGRTRRAADHSDTVLERPTA
ncbi:MAG: hypothetical protein H0W98_06460 [Chloroflexi bacterium]|nr:hypothetical protein [Chloroflexota bacterium]